MSDFNFRNVLTISLAIVVVFVTLIVGIVAYNVNQSNRLRDMRVQHYITCQHAAPEQVVSCLVVG